MVKRMVWVERSVPLGLEAEKIDAHLRELNVALPAGLPIEGWKRENGRMVEVCAERFPGSTPVWIWEE